MSLNDTTNEIPYGYCQCGCGQLTKISKITSRGDGRIRGQPMRFVVGHATRRPAAERLWRKVSKAAPSGCWEWQGSKDKKGYGRININKRPVLTHRFAWELENGPIPDGKDVLHSCDNPCCVNPSHLFLGTNDDNIADKVDKGRQERGSGHHRAKLTENQVIEIRRRYALGNISHSQLAAEYGVCRMAVTDIISRRNWAHIP